jgi:hypothetical protein
MYIDLTFAFDPTSTSCPSSSSGPSSISSLVHASVDADVSTNLLTTFSIGHSRWKRCIDLSTNLQSQIK